MRPVLLLDVDGVVNVFPPPSKGVKHGKHNRYWGGWHKQEFKHEEAMLPFVHSTEMFDAITALYEHMDIMWLTTWQSFTQDLLAQLLGSDDFRFPYLQRGEGTEFYRPWDNEPWWKVKSLDAEISANPRPFIWVDDNYSKMLRLQVQDIAKKNNVKGDLLRAYESLGLTNRMVKDIKSFFNVTPSPYKV